MYRSYISNICGKRKCVVSDSNDNIHYFIWYHFVAVPILGRNDDVSWNDYADGGMVNNNMDKESVEERKESGNSKTDKETYIFIVNQRNYCYGTVIYNFNCIKNTQYNILYDIYGFVSWKKREASV